MKPKLKNDHPVSDIIKNRWSPRAFSGEKIKEEDVKSLFEAARWAASSRNSQPWRFIYSQDHESELYKNIFSCMVEWNQSWAQSAPLIVIGLAQSYTDGKKYENGHALYDLGLGVGNLTTQATSLGLYLHQMGGFEPEKVSELFNLTDQYIPVVMFAVGYPGDLNNIPADIAADEHLPQERFPIEEIAFDNKESISKYLK